MMWPKEDWRLSSKNRNRLRMIALAYITHGTLAVFFGILTFFSISFIFLLLALHFNAMLACFLVRFILFYCQFLRLFFIIHKNKREEREKISIKIENISSYKRAQRTQPRSKNIYFSILIKPDILSQNRNSLRIFRPLV